MTTPEMITTNAALAAFCRLAADSQIMVVDTEFVRTRTLRANLGLVQARCQDTTVLIDPLADIDLEPFWALLQLPSLMKVIHAGGEDYEIFWQQTGALAVNVFDSQVAAAFAGLGDSLGYAALVEKFCQVELDKSQSRTDWTKRPLALEQLTYAAADVDYLLKLFPALLAEVEQKQKLDLVLAESAFQVAKRAQQTPAHWLYLFLGNAWQCDGKQLVVLRELTRWRQERAENQNIPLGFIAKEHDLIAMARRQPQSKSQLRQVTELSEMTLRYAATDIIQAIEQAMVVAEHEELPTLERLTDMEGYKGIFKGVQQLVKTHAERLDISPALVGSRRQINDVIHWFWQIPKEIRAELTKPDLLTSWRGAALADELAELLSRP